MDLIEKIKKHALENYASSPHHYTDDEVSVIIDNNCNCCNCYNDIFELDDFPEIRNNQVYCEDCYEFYERCSICEESFEKAEKAQDFKLVIAKDLAEKEEIKAGIYKVLKFPFFRTCVVFGFQSLISSNLSLIREKLDWHIKIQSGEICECCYDKFTMA